MRSKSSICSQTRIQSKLDCYFNSSLRFSDMFLMCRFLSMPLSTLALVKTLRGLVHKVLFVAKLLMSRLSEESIKQSRFSPLAYVQTHSLCALLLTSSQTRDSAFRNVKSVAECLADELINAAKGSSNSYAIKVCCTTFEFLLP
jgi:hypothetical protein